jgi:trimethylamine--corrinoid protein Co-methyltransferase
MAAQGLVRNFKPLEILSEEQVQAIHAGALDVLEVTGVAFESPRALEILGRAGARIDPDNQRARIPAGLAVASCRMCPSSFHMHARDPRHDLHIGGPSTYFSLFSGMRIVDLETWEARTPTVERTTTRKVADQLEHVLATSYTPYCEFVRRRPCCCR